MDFTPRGQIAFFLILTFVIGYCIEAYIISAVGSLYSPLTLLLVWTPGFAGLFCSWFFGHRFGDLGLRLPLGKYFVLAYAMPAVCVLAMLLVSLIGGIGKLGDYSSRGVLRLFFAAPTLGVLLEMFTSAGQEFGWRGFLQDRMQELEIPYPDLMVGLLWAAWYWPLVIFGIYSPTRLPILTLFTFSIVLISFAVFLGWLKRTSGSIWPPILCHAVHSVWLNTIYSGIFRGGPLDTYLGGECGFILATLYLLAAIVLLRQQEPDNLEA
jgi:membrane protease YdiL (CAAX protease family)